MVLKDHAYDDGAGQPEEQGEEGGDKPVLTPFDFNDPGNMLKDAGWDLSRYYAHGDGWEGYNAEDITYTNEGNQKFVVTLPYESNQRWQAQFQLQNLGGVSTVAGKNYDSASRIRIRGVGTVNNSDPLYIVDGMPIEGGLDYINPSCRIRFLQAAGQR